MPKVWVVCTVSPDGARSSERVVTVVTASGMPYAFFARASEVTEEGNGRGHVRVTFCGRRENFILTAVNTGGDLASTTFLLVRDEIVTFDDRWSSHHANLMPTRVTCPSRKDTRANYRAARARYRLVREQLESRGVEPQALDELFMSMEQSIDPFVRWEVIAEEELGDRHDDA